jgi:hypothetical protein
MIDKADETDIADPSDSTTFAKRENTPIPGPIVD